MITLKSYAPEKDDITFSFIQVCWELDLNHFGHNTLTKPYNKPKYWAYLGEKCLMAILNQDESVQTSSNDRVKYLMAYRW